MTLQATSFYKAKLIHLAGKVPIVAPKLRRYANQFSEGSVTTIRSGCAAGYKWKRYHRYVNGYWTGQYELEIQEAIVRELSPGDTFFDVGANAGFFSLIAARRVGPEGRVVAFEPLPANIECIAAQTKLNNLQNCRLCTEALADHVGTAAFYCGRDASMAHLGETQSGEKSIEVKLNTLDNAAQKWGTPNLIKMDIEGAEVDALKGTSAVLSQRQSTFLIELHSDECKKGVRRILDAAGYTFFDILGEKLIPGSALPHHILAK